MIQVKSQVVQVKLMVLTRDPRTAGTVRFLPSKLGFLWVQQKYREWWQRKQKQLRARFVQNTWIIILLIYQTEGLILLLILILIYFWTKSSAVMIARKNRAKRNVIILAKNDIFILKWPEKAQFRSLNYFFCFF